MSDQNAEVLDFLRENFTRIHSRLDTLSAAMLDLSHRVTSLVAQVALVHGDFANQSIRMDRIETRLDRIERRLDIVAAPS